ncbi:uncharacterized protein LOC131671017 [Phymastichus coffea]|uniref:uncharacterized protein LOC131671017 n=1 Tax=Phymastichus coffea TaxID=108790 RepID=UPI00273C9892|nr:uncharacterized protein LOC131671017 [Phymastichus coffea]
MRCALLILVALLEARALRTERLEEPTKDKGAATQLQGWARLTPPAAHDAFDARTFRLDAVDLEDERNDYEYPDQRLKSIDQLDEPQLQRMANYLVKVLQRPDVYEAPVLLAREPVDELDDSRPYPLELDDPRSVTKRTRYYRPYPWKRQNSRSYQSDYEPYNACTLTRKDVFNLLVALHDARQGNKSRIVNFCNRKRPASAIYTNIRFLGRRRK